jgi:hypothetical protein
MSQPTVVGGLIHLDRVAAILKETEVVEERVLVYVAICTVGYRPQTKEQASLVKDLWNNGVRATVLDHCQVLIIFFFPIVCFLVLIFYKCFTES